MDFVIATTNPELCKEVMDACPYLSPAARDPASLRCCAREGARQAAGPGVL